MRIKANGKNEELLEGELTLLNYLERKGVRPETVAVELNGAVLARSEYAAARLREGDAVEIVKFVGGG